MLAYKFETLLKTPSNAKSSNTIHLLKNMDWYKMGSYYN